MNFWKYIVDISKFHSMNEIGFTLFITNRCNVNCRHCFYKEKINSPVEELSLDEIRKLARYLRRFNNGISITGGEPFLREDIADIVEVLADNGIKKININSNGLATQQILKIAKRISCLDDIDFSISISIDGMKETHDNIRNSPGIFNQAVMTIEELQKIGIKVKILMDLNAFNYRDIGRVYNFCFDQLKIQPGLELIRGIDISGIPIQEANTYYHPPEKQLLITKNMVPEVRKTLNIFFSKQIRENPSKLLPYSVSLAQIQCLLDIVEQQKNILKCYAGRKHIVIYENGDVSLCEMARSAGNLRNVNFNIWQLWHNDFANQQRRFIKDCYCTHSCYVNVFYSIYFIKKLIITLIKQLLKLSNFAKGKLL